MKNLTLTSAIILMLGMPAYAESDHSAGHGEAKADEAHGDANDGMKFAKGIKKIDADGGKVTINHGPLHNLDMPAMTMVFRADADMIAKMSEGQDIEFIAEPVKGKLTVTHLK